jgi:hypothetical protein
VNGKIVDGKYYLGAHGKYSAVDQSICGFSRYYTYSVWISIVPGFIAAIMLIRKQENVDERTTTSM